MNTLVFIPLILIYTVVLYGFGTYINLIEYLDLFHCFACKELDKLQSNYDYIIVGCGSAGSIVAKRLLEDKHITVLVLEAGPHSGRFLDIPAIGPLLQLSSVDWQYRTVPQKNATQALHKQINNWPMGRAVGGTGRLNNMVYLRGHPADFEDWYKNDRRFNYGIDILSYFKKAEDHKGSYHNDTTYHSTTGPLIVEDLPYVSALAQSVLEAAKTLGFIIRDLNGRINTGFMQTQANINSGSRSTPAERLLKSYKSNFYIQTNSFIHKILFKSNYEAYAVKYSYLRYTYTVQARKGIILSAGVIGTPKILMLSGIGPQEHLKEIGIETKINLPVGNNLQDHVTTGTDLILLDTDLGIGFQSMLSPFSAFNYFYGATGPWTSVGCEVVAVIDTENKSFSNRPDLELMVIPLGISSDGGRHLQNAFGITDAIWSNYFAPLFGKNTISILPIVLHPKSKGTVRLADNIPYTHPIINPNYLSDPYDVKILLKGIDLMKKIIATEPMQKLGARLNNQKFPGCENFSFDTEPYWECYVRHLTLTAYHQGGTCKMGADTDSEAVVNYNFQVRGTNKLFVVDASIMPSLTSGNPNAAVVMLAEKAADAIKYHNYVSRDTCRRKEVILKKRQCCKVSLGILKN